MATSPEIRNREPQPADVEASTAKLRDQNGCCGGPAPQGRDACCALDADAKTAGGSGCGCAAKKAVGTKSATGCC